MPPTCTNLALYRALLSLGIPESQAAAAAEAIVTPAAPSSTVPHESTSSSLGTRSVGMTADELSRHRRRCLVWGIGVPWVGLGLLVPAGVFLPLPAFLCAAVVLIFASDRVLSTALRV